MADRLRLLWDFGDLDATERRLREQLESERTATGRAEVLTQLARVKGLHGRFEGGERLLVEAEEEGGAGNRVLGNRVLLERGRLRRSAGEPSAALPLFESAYAGALEAGDLFLAADAAHMAAIAAGDFEELEAWTHRGIALAERDDDAAYWLGPLLNNLGWSLFERGAHDEALTAFTRALEARERDPSNPDAIAIARYAVGKTLRALGRAREAIPLLEHAVAWSENGGSPDGWFEEELALEYAAVGRRQDAAPHAGRALELLPGADPSFAGDAGRVAALEAIAG